MAEAEGAVGKVMATAGTGMRPTRKAGPSVTRATSSVSNVTRQVTTPIVVQVEKRRREMKLIMLEWRTSSRR